MEKYNPGEKVKIGDHEYEIAGEPICGGCADIYPLVTAPNTCELVLKVYNPKSFSFGDTILNNGRLLEEEAALTAMAGDGMHQSPVRIVAYDGGKIVETKLPDDLHPLSKTKQQLGELSDDKKTKTKTVNTLYIIRSLVRFLETLNSLGYSHLDLLCKARF